MSKLSGTLAIRHGSCGQTTSYSTGQILYNQANHAHIVDKVYHAYPYFRMAPNVKGAYYRHSGGYPHTYLYEFDTGKIEFVNRYSNDVWVHTAFIMDPNDQVAIIICNEIAELINQSYDYGKA